MPSNNSRSRRTQRHEDALIRQAAYDAMDNQERLDHLLANNRADTADARRLADFLAVDLLQQTKLVKLLTEPTVFDKSLS